jgi:hypothetical protein
MPDMEEKFIMPQKFRLLTFGLMAVGLISLVLGFIFDAPRAWANYLLNNYYFLSLAVGGAFFLALQYITQSGWASGFKRVPEAMSSYIPVGGVLFLLLFFGMHYVYSWSGETAVHSDKLLLYKSPYLNVPFFFIRLLVFFVVWTIFIRILRNFSRKEDLSGGLKYFYKSELYSRILIFILAITFSIFAIDALMSLEPHWYSTLFAGKSFMAAFLHGSSIVGLIVIILHRQGYYQFLNRSHLHDFSRYIFMPCIIWGYVNFAEFMLIWYGNLPDETAWFFNRWHGVFKALFFANILINWFIPFMVLMPRKTSRSRMFITPVILALIAGQYIELYYIIWPDIVQAPKFGLMEIGTFLGFTGLFAFVVATTLSKTKLIPENHPYFEESLHHHF